MWLPPRRPSSQCVSQASCSGSASSISLLHRSSSNARPGWRLVALSALVLGHWALLTEPMLASPAGLAQAHNLAGSVDRAVFGSHTLTQQVIPKGWWERFPRSARALLGSIAGDWLLKTHPIGYAWRDWSAAGWPPSASGCFGRPVLPLNKSLWTGSFVFFTGGIATLMLAICYVLFDVYDYRRWAQPLAWLRLQPPRDLLPRRVMRPPARCTLAPGGGPADDSRAWIFWDLLRPLAPDVRDEWLSLAFALVTVSCWTAVAGALHRRRIRIHV